MGVTRVRYSEAFKQQVVQDLEQGKFRSLHEACRKYGIGGTTTVSNWVRRYGSEDMLPKNVRIETMNLKRAVEIFIWSNTAAFAVRQQVV